MFYLCQLIFTTSVSLSKVLQILFVHLRHRRVFGMSRMRHFRGLYLALAKRMIPHSRFDAGVVATRLPQPQGTQQI